MDVAGPCDRGSFCAAEPAGQGGAEGARPGARLAHPFCAEGPDARMGRAMVGRREEGSRRFEAQEGNMVGGRGSGGGRWRGRHLRPRHRRRRDAACYGRAPGGKIGKGVTSRKGMARGGSNGGGVGGEIGTFDYVDRRRRARRAACWPTGSRPIRGQACCCSRRAARTTGSGSTSRSAISTPRTTRAPTGAFGPSPSRA